MDPALAVFLFFRNLWMNIDTKFSIFYNVTVSKKFGKLDKEGYYEKDSSSC